MTAINVRGGTADPNRGKYCTSEKWAGYVGPWDLDPFTNRRSHIVASVHCMLDERGDNGFGIGARVPGWYFARKTSNRKPIGKGESARAKDVIGRATEETRVWIQPDYQFVDEALDHYGHTRFCALLRFDPRTAWWHRLVVLIRRRRGMICIPRGVFNFEPPPGVQASSNSFPHALYYADERDVTRDVLRRCESYRP
jgi:hypothetical protein